MDLEYWKRMRYVIKIVRLEGLVLQPESLRFHGFVKFYDPDAFGGRGDLQVTQEIKEAQHFKTVNEALDFYNQQSKRQPIRSDGEPNRPMTAFTIELCEDPL